MIKKAILWDWWGGLLEAPTISLSSGVFTVSNTLASDPNLSPVVDDVIITGTTTEDEVLTATPSARLRSPYAISSYTYQWYRSNTKDAGTRAAIAGATSSTYTLLTADVTKFIDCAVTVIQSGGNNTTSDTYISRRVSDAIASSSSLVAIDINFRRNAEPAGAAKSPATAFNEITHTILSLSNLKDTDDNTLTGVGAVLSNNGGVPGIDDGNLSSNSTIFSDASLDTNLQVVKGNIETLTISGLNNALTYAIEFMGTRSAGASGTNRIGTIKGGGTGTDVSSGTYDAYQQTSTVRVEGMSTDGSGNLIITLEATGTAGANNFLPMSSIRIEYV